MEDRRVGFPGALILLALIAAVLIYFGLGRSFPALRAPTVSQPTESARSTVIAQPTAVIHYSNRPLTAAQIKAVRAWNTSESMDTDVYMLACVTDMAPFENAPLTYAAISASTSALVYDCGHALAGITVPPASLADLAVVHDDYASQRALLSDGADANTSVLAKDMKAWTTADYQLNEATNFGE